MGGPPRERPPLALVDEPRLVDLSLGATWKQDLGAGIVVFLVALPLCLGIALASGAPLMSGIITGIVGGLVVSRLSGSALMVSGPAAGLTAIVLSAIATLGSFQAFLAAVVLAGLMQIALGAMRAGIIGYFFPSSVIKGMLAAIGLILILKQLPYAFGAELIIGGGGADGASAGDPSGLAAIAAAAASMHLGAVVLTVVSLAILVVWDLKRFKRLKKLMPAPLLLVGLGIAGKFLFDLMGTSWALPQNALVQLPPMDSPAAMLGIFTAPDWSTFTNPAVFTVAVTLALVASLETLLSQEATDKLDPLKRRSPANRELFAQGVGNTLSGLIGGLPMTGVIVRSSANVDAGGMTWRSAFIHGVFLLGAVAVLSGVLNLIPLATLAAILLYTGYKLAKPALFVEAARIGRSYLIPFTVTVLAILATDLLTGIAIGSAVAVGFLLHENSKHAYFFHREESEDHHRVRLDLAEEVTFLNKARVAAVLHELPANTILTVDGTRSKFIDSDVVEILHEFETTARTKNITLRLVGIPATAAAAGAQ